jgi:hypothetical protein
MGSWKNTDAAANSVFYAAYQAGVTANSVNRAALFGNTTVGAFYDGKAVGQFGVSAAEMANTTGEAGKVTHAGWVLREAGTGSIVSVAITGGGTAYANTDTFSVTSPTSNATGNITTNGSGVITSVTLTNAGAGFEDVTNSVTITTGTGSGATLTATAGGRAGRVNYETLVAMNNITGDASDDALLPE